MNPKKLAILFYGFIGAVVLLALYLLYFQQQQAKRKTVNDAINSVSRADNSQSQKTPQPVKPLTVVTSAQLIEGSKSESSKTSENNTLTYLDVYQDLQTARACQMFYRHWKNYGLESDISKIVRRPHVFYGQTDYPQTEQVPLTAEQTETLEYWVQQCYQIWADYGVFDGNKMESMPLNDVLEAVAQKLLTVVPKTPKEMELKQTRRRLVDWQASYQSLETALEGDDSLEPAQAQALYDELATLQSLDDEIKQQWFAAQRNNQPNETALRDQHFDLLNQIRALKKSIMEQKLVNPEKLEHAELDFQHKDQVINQALRTDDGDVFFEIIYSINGRQTGLFFLLGFEQLSNWSEPVKQYRVTPDQMVYEASGKENRDLHQWDLRYATHLYLCDLGWNCGPKSPIVMNYCLLGFMGSYPEACGKSLTEFYRTALTSPNRWPDVMYFKGLYQELFYE